MKNVLIIENDKSLADLVEPHLKSLNLLPYWLKTPEEAAKVSVDGFSDADGTLMQRSIFQVNFVCFWVYPVDG